jgi:ribose transport system permease protein
MSATSIEAGSNSVVRNSLVKLTKGAGLIVGIYLILYALYVYQQPRALSASAIAALINNTAPLALAAMGQTLVVISRGFDLSVAGVISL